MAVKFRFALANKRESIHEMMSSFILKTLPSKSQILLKAIDVSYKPIKRLKSMNGKIFYLKF